jgi:hypothetical protein
MMWRAVAKKTVYIMYVAPKLMAIKNLWKSREKFAGAKSAKNYSDFAKFKLEQHHTLNVNITEHYNLRF